MGVQAQDRGHSPYPFGCGSGYMGVVFEDYVDGLWQRISRDSEALYSGPTEMESYVEGDDQQVCDGLLATDSGVLFIEVKASRLSADARSGANWDGYQKRTSDMFVDGLGQLAATMNSVHEGGGREDQLAGKPWVPLLVLLEPIVMNRVLYEDMDARATAAGVQFPASAKPWQVLHVEELEIFEAIGGDAPETLVQLLVEKAGSQVTVSENLTNHCHANEVDLVRGDHSPYLEQRFEELGKVVLETFEGRMRASE